MILLDTNLLTRIARKTHPHGGLARAAVDSLFARGEQLVIVPQNLYEFWAVATRPVGMRPPGANGLGMTTNQASQWLDFFQRRFILLHDRDELSSRWQTLVKTVGIRGHRAHDARLVAAMQCYGITRLLTFNGDDFKNCAVTLIDPASI